MSRIIYIERAVQDHPRTREICARFPDASYVPCERYGEVFNPGAQNFRLQKKQPALILAEKMDGLVLEAPEGYGIGGNRNFYFSHMLNCVYDCRYCFLQGMYRSAHRVLFVNYEDFEQAIDDKCRAAGEGDTWFFSGYDCDSLAMEPVSGFMAHFLPFFADHSDAYLELRTKSTQIRSLLNSEPLPNVVVAFSFTPQAVSDALEHKVPTVSKRLDAMARLQESGWQVGLRFDPMIYHTEYRQQYRELFAHTFEVLDAQRVHSISLGSFRLPRDFFKTMVRLYPDEPLFAGPLEEQAGMVSYKQALETEMTEFCTRELLRYTPAEMLHPARNAA